MSKTTKEKKCTNWQSLYTSEEISNSSLINLLFFFYFDNVFALFQKYLWKIIFTHFKNRIY